MAFREKWTADTCAPNKDHQWCTKESLIRHADKYTKSHLFEVGVAVICSCRCINSHPLLPVSQVFSPPGHSFEMTAWNGPFGEKKSSLVSRGLVRCTSALTENMAKELKKGPGMRLYSFTDEGKKLADYLHLSAEQQHLPLVAEGKQGSGDLCKGSGTVPSPY